jgi:hypothetical protein
LQNRKDKGRGGVCKRAFSANFCAAIAAIFRVRRAVALNGAWMTGGFVASGSDFIHRID